MTKYEVQKLTRNLEKMYPIEGSYGSRRSLYQKALNDSVITEEQMHEAQVYYGRIWNYTGD